MFEVVLRLFTLQAISVHPMIYWGMGVVWVAMLLATWSSIKGLPVSAGRRWFWLLLVVLVPIVGLFLYLMRCLVTADYGFMKFLVGPPSHVKKALRAPEKNTHA